MITKDDKLEIFENFRTDRKLPKFANPKTVYKSSEEDSGGDITMSEDEFKSTFITAPRLMIRGNTRKRGFWGWLFQLFTRHESFEKKPAISIPEFFLSVKNSVQELEVINSRASGYNLAIEQAEKAGQTALLEKLKAGLIVYRNETQLVAIESRKYITEADLVRFVKQAKRGLRLDWVGNFIRMIPPDIIDRKLEMDGLGIFDNYVVLHYDPDKKSWAETQAEIAARRDPILFGLISGSRNLYFVGDWIDEKCDLTLEQIVDQLGPSVVKEVQ